jgi:hypothetical protein
MLAGSASCTRSTEDVRWYVAGLVIFGLSFAFHSPALDVGPQPSARPPDMLSVIARLKRLLDTPLLRAFEGPAARLARRGRAV